jgi:divalent metal cation (Fe/Co/Zn/Cd) transporter
MILKILNAYTLKNHLEADCSNHPSDISNFIAALMTIVIANAMGWVSIEEVSGEIIDKIGRF